METSVLVQRPTTSRRTSEKRSDRALVHAVQDGSQAAAEELARRHWSTAFKAAFLILRSKEDAEDVAQESLVAALAGIRRFHRNRPFGPWVRKIVANRAIDLTRSAARRRELEESVRGSMREQISSSEGVGFSDPELVAAIAGLPLEQREVVVLRHVLGFGTGEIARILKIPRGTVGSRLRRGLNELEDTYRRPT